MADSQEVSRQAGSASALSGGVMRGFAAWRIMVICRYRLSAAGALALEDVADDRVWMSHRLPPPSRKARQRKVVE